MHYTHILNQDIAPENPDWRNSAEARECRLCQVKVPTMNHWMDHAHDPGHNLKLINFLVERETKGPMASKKPTDKHCPICDTTISGIENWENHIRGKKHLQLKQQNMLGTEERGEAAPVPQPFLNATPPLLSTESETWGGRTTSAGWDSLALNAPAGLPRSAPLGTSEPPTRSHQPPTGPPRQLAAVSDPRIVTEAGLVKLGRTEDQSTWGIQPPGGNYTVHFAKCAMSKSNWDEVEEAARSDEGDGAIKFLVNTCPLSLEASITIASDTDKSLVEAWVDVFKDQCGDALRVSKIATRKVPFDIFASEGESVAAGSNVALSEKASVSKPQPTKPHRRQVGGDNGIWLRPHPNPIW